MAFSTKIFVEENMSVIWLIDDTAGVEAAVVPSLGNRTIRILIHGQNLLHFPFENPAAAKADRGLNGIPFLAPWANRMAGGGFHANGHEFRFNEALGSIRADSNGLAIHGMLTASPLWQFVSIGSDKSQAQVTSRLDFWKEPALMANWPFAHSYEMTHTLSAAGLEVSTSIVNQGSERMPVSIGFHPYFRIPGLRRDDAILHLPVHRHVETDSRLVPTGEYKPVDFTAGVPLKGNRFDDGFIGLEPNPVFRCEAAGKQISVAFGPRFPVAVVYAPPDRDYVCFEPMTALTNGVNLAAEGKYPDLQWIDPGAEWRESFRVSWQGW
jgi:aldose 1-epimerase